MQVTLFNYPVLQLSKIEVVNNNYPVLELHKIENEEENYPVRELKLKNLRVNFVKLVHYKI